MKVAITGGTGSIGRGLVLRHVAAGDHVRALSRRPINQTGFPDAVRVYPGDLSSAGDARVLAHFVEGADVVYHCAGEVASTSRMQAVHIDGTRALVRAASGKIGHWVHLSSVGVYGPRRRGVVTEESALRPDGVYETTKAESDQIVEQGAEGGGFSWAILRPSIVFGPDMRNQSLRQMTGMIQRGLFCFVGARGASANYIFVDNVIDALWCCGRMGAARGRVYNLSDHRTMEDFVAPIASALCKACPRLRMPEWPTRLISRVLGRVAGFPLTESRVDAMTTRVLYPATRIEHELGYAHATTMEDALSLCVRRWKASG